ncbi:MAG: ABC transporter permease [Chloroflexota bacterium]|nr:ABC transporter permease [Chloroflexota bacterium]
MFRFSISNAFRRKGIALVAIIGTALGVALMTVLLSISDGMEQQMSETMNELSGGIAVYPADASMGFMLPGGTPFSVSYADEIEAIDHVDVVVPQALALLSSDVAGLGSILGTTIRGVDLELDAELGGATALANIIEGETISGENEVILGKTLVAGEGGMMGGGGTETYEVGDTIEVPIHGSDPIELTVVGIFETGNSLYDSSIYSDMATARAIMGLADDELNYIAVEADDPDNVATIAEEIEVLFEDAEVPIQTVVATDSLESISDTMSTFRSFLWIISLVAAIAGGVSIFIVMLISVVERTKEFGILKASGWSNWNIINSVVVQSITISLLGAAVGLGLGYLAGGGIDQYLATGIAIITWRLVVIIAAFGIFVGLVGGLYPAVRAARVSPIESMRAV